MNTKAENTMTRRSEFSPLLTGNDYPQPLIDSVISGVRLPLSARVDTNQFIRFLLGSYSLPLTDKFRVIAALPTLSQFQCDALLGVGVDETREFQALVPTKWRTVMCLCAKTWISANMLANYFGAGYGEVEESNALQTMLAAKYDTPEKRAWIQRGLADNQAMAWHVFGSALIHPHESKTVLQCNQQSVSSPGVFRYKKVMLPNEF